MEEIKKQVTQNMVDNATMKAENKTIFGKLDDIERKLDKVLDRMNGKIDKIQADYMPRNECLQKDHVVERLENNFTGHEKEHRSLNVKIVFSLLAALSSVVMFIIKGLK